MPRAQSRGTSPLTRPQSVPEGSFAGDQGRRWCRLGLQGSLPGLRRVSRRQASSGQADSDVTSCTIWNPQEKGKSMADMEDGGWVSQLVRPVTRYSGPLCQAGIARKTLLPRRLESRLTSLLTPHRTGTSVSSPDSSASSSRSSPERSSSGSRSSRCCEARRGCDGAGCQARL